MSEPLYRVRCRCERNPLAVEMVGGNPVLEMITDPMPIADARSWELDARSLMTSAEWVFTIEACHEPIERKEPDAN